ncbi:MAG: glutamate synthase subunit beta [Candidatus Omnitrophota bacterium]
MGDPKGFLKLSRKEGDYRAVCERIQDFKDVSKVRSQAASQEQASRCMDCGTPFCHSACPIGNYIPEWNDHMFHGRWKDALLLLEATNNLPEVTGRVCPAICEYACVLGINNDAVTIRENELSVIEAGFQKGIIKPIKIKNRTGKKVAVIGSGPAGLSCASSLNRAGHTVSVFERDKEIGGILRYGIPDFKLEKHILDRRVKIWKEEGVIFRVGVDVGKDYKSDKLLNDFDAVCLAGGSRAPRDLKIEGRDLKGIYFAMDYLTQANKRANGEKIVKNRLIDAKDRSVVVIGGGDTGSDCVGTAIRQGAKCVVQIEVLPRPSECRGDECPWPNFPLLLKTTSSHKEGSQRHWSVSTKKFTGEKGHVKKLICESNDPSKKGQTFDINADLAILAIGFLHPEKEGLLMDLGVEFDNRGNVKTDESYVTSTKNVFCAGDMRRGQSLVVWAISEGRKCAHHIDRYLMGDTSLPSM